MARCNYGARLNNDTSNHMRCPERTEGESMLCAKHKALQLAKVRAMPQPWIGAGLRWSGQYTIETARKHSV